MTTLALYIALPEDWTEMIAVMLGDRLAEKELPPGLQMQLGTVSPDADEFGRVLKAWAT